MDRYNNIKVDVLQGFNPNYHPIGRVFKKLVESYYALKTRTDYSFKDSFLIKLINCSIMAPLEPVIKYLFLRLNQKKRVDDSSQLVRVAMRGVEL